MSDAKVRARAALMKHKMSGLSDPCWVESTIDDLIPDIEAEMIEYAKEQLAEPINCYRCRKEIEFRANRLFCFCVNCKGEDK